MRKLNILICLCCFVLISFLSLAQANIIDSCVAVVNDDVITLSEVNEAGKPIFQRIAEQVAPEQLAEALKQSRKTIIKKLIDKKLLMQQAKLMHISVSDQEVDHALARILERNNTSKERFKAELAKMGMTEEQYRQNLREQALGSKLINYEVRSKIVITENDILDYYDKHYTEQIGSGGYYILQIGITFDGNDMPEDLTKARKLARKKIDEIRKMAINGKDFKQLARQFSRLPSAADGGDIGAFKEDEMAAYMRKAVTSLSPGDISPVVEAPDGYMIFKLLSSQEGEIITKIPYESVKDEIRSTLYKQKMAKRYETWLKGIRQQAYIKIL